MSREPLKEAIVDALKVIRPADRVAEVASGAMVREGAIAERVVGAQKIWLGYAELPGGMVSSVHHHGEAESGIYIISGRARFYGGPDLADVQEAEAGDFIWVPPQLIHVEQNAREGEPVQMIVARSTQETLVFNLPTPDGWNPKR